MSARQIDMFAMARQTIIDRARFEDAEARAARTVCDWRDPKDRSAYVADRKRERRNRALDAYGLAQGGPCPLCSLRVGARQLVLVDAKRVDRALAIADRGSASDKETAREVVGAMASRPWFVCCRRCNLLRLGPLLGLDRPYSRRKR